MNFFQEKLKAVKKLISVDENIDMDIDELSKHLMIIFDMLGISVDKVIITRYMLWFRFIKTGAVYIPAKVPILFYLALELRRYWQKMPGMCIYPGWSEVPNGDVWEFDRIAFAAAYLCSWHSPYRPEELPIILDPVLPLIRQFDADHLLTYIKALNSDYSLWDSDKLYVIHPGLHWSDYLA